MPAGKSFDQFFANDLEDTLRPLEEERKKIAKKAFFSCFLGGMALIFFLISAYAGERSGAVTLVALIGIIAFISAIILLFIYGNRKRDYVTAFKQKIVKQVIYFIDPSLTYFPDNCVSENDYGRSGLFLQKADRFEGDDYVEGKRDKTFFCFSELHTKHRVSTGKSSHMETIFSGLFFIGDFNKNFSGRTYVWSEENPQLNFFTKIFSSLPGNLEKVRLESTEFERRFIVYSTDQVEARYILTPSFMERMTKLDEMMGPGISFSFVNTNINVAVPISEALFEPSIFSANDYQKLGEYYNTVHIVFDIIDELKLNQRLWNKE